MNTSIIFCFSRVTMILALLGAATVPAGAASTETKRRIDEVRAAAAQRKSFLLEIVPPPPEAVAQSGATGTILWAPPYFHRVHSTEPVPGIGKVEHISTCDGETIWSYFPSEKTAGKIDLKELKRRFGVEELVRRGILMSSDPFQGADEERVRFVREADIGGVTCYVFELPAAGKRARLMSADSMRLWIGVKDGLLRRQETFYQSGELLDRTNMRVISTDAPVSPEDFRLKLPTDCAVKDLTKSVADYLEERAKD